MSEARLTFAIASEVGPDNRGWVQLHMPTGGVVSKGKQKFEVTPADIAAFAEYIKANPGRVPIDYDHSFDKSGSSLAAGWVDSSTVEVRDGGELWAMADWTPTAAQQIRDGAYRYISPEFTFKTSKNGVWRGAGKFIAATLTNRPFLKDMAAVRLDEDATIEPTEGDTMKDLAKTLGLAEDADEKTILAAITARDEKITAAEAETAEARTALDAAKAELDALKTTATDADKKVTALEMQVQTLAKDAHETKRAALLDAAIAGPKPKMLPAEREAMVSLYDKAGHDAIVALLDARPEIPLNQGRGSGGDLPGNGDAGDVGGTPIDPESAALHAKVDAHLKGLKLDHEPTQDDYLRAVAAVS